MIPPYIGADVLYYPINDDDVANFTGDVEGKAAKIVGINEDDDAVDLMVFIPAMIASRGMFARMHVPHNDPELVMSFPHWEWIHTAALANAKAVSE